MTISFSDLARLVEKDMDDKRGADEASAAESHYRDTGRGHVVIVPCPLQGHLNPMLHLANLLHASGFSITLIHIQTTHHRNSHQDLFSKYVPNFLVEVIAVEQDDGDESRIEDVMSFLLSLNSKCQVVFGECVAKVVSSRLGRVSCIIHDAVLYFLVDVVRDLKIPRLVLRTSTAANFLSLSLIDQKARLPAAAQGQLEGALVKELPSMRAKDMPLFDRGCLESAERVLNSIYQATTTAAAIVWNTFSCLEQLSLDTIRAAISVPIFVIGPLHKLSEATIVPRSLLVIEDRSCLEWLDSQPPRSVIYISTGSLVTLTAGELTEMAAGIADSGKPFLWVIRVGILKPSSQGHGHVNNVNMIITKLGAAAGRQGKITAWAPQREVLAHRSVNCFWTHNGWNSTMESICEGVPMLCWPCVGDQRVIARLVSEVWRIGLQLEGLDRGKIVRAINRLMADEGTKKRAMELKDKVEDSLRPAGAGGSSSSCHQSLTKLVSFVLSVNN